MYIALCDIEILRSEEVRTLKEAYLEKHKESFIFFNYADFRGSKEKCAAQEYLETLREAVKTDQPYHIVSHRYDEFDH